MSTHTLDKRLVSLQAPASFAAEQYQGLRMTVERLKALRDVRVIAVTSPAAGDGKTVTAINLAGALGHGSKTRVLLIDADLRRPAVAARLGIEGADTRGLVDAVSDAKGQMQDVTRTVNGFNLSVVPAGLVDAPIHEILRSDRLERLLQQARQDYDYIVLDTPPLLPVFDAALLSRLVDGVIVVIAANRTPRKLVGEALNVLDPSKVLGIVFNGDARPLFGYYDSSYRRYFTETARHP
jgi:capsular exopolysaccharide synthesis family protein